MPDSANKVALCHFVIMCQPVTKLEKLYNHISFLPIAARDSLTALTRPSGKHPFHITFSSRALVASFLLFQ